MDHPNRSDSQGAPPGGGEHLLAGLAHELRNGLFGITASLDAFEARFEGDPEAGKYAAALRRSLHRLSTFAEELGELGDPNPMAGADLDPSALWREASEARLARGGKPVELQAAEAFALCRMRGDGRTLRSLWEQFQDLACLGGNPRPIVGLELEEQAGRRQLRGRVELRWSVPDSDPERVFEPFHWRPEGLSRLTLPLVRRRVEALGGSAWAEVRDPGWSVVFALPVL